MKHITKRGNKFYYRRRIPSTLSHLSTIKVIYRPLSEDVDMAQELASIYDSTIIMIEYGLKLNQDVSQLVSNLGIKASKRTDLYEMYMNAQEVGNDRTAKILRLMLVVRELLPLDISKVDMAMLDSVRDNIILLPKRSLAKYKGVSVRKTLLMNAPAEDRLSTSAVNDHLFILNSLLKFAFERDMINKEYSVKMVKKTTTDKEERIALDLDTIKDTVKGSKTAKLASSFTLLFLTGMRPSEAYKCKITEVDGIKCFDLTDTSIKLKNKGSHRLIPVHKSIDKPEQMLEDYGSINPRMISRDFCKNLEKGTLYSLRHSFATQLASKGIEPHIISELLGHTHAGMTLGRYVKGFPIKLLSESINKLNAV